ncbi:GPGG-motif small membrane protein [Aeromicrobium sp. UC242_57]
MGFLLWIIAVALVIYGIITLVNGSILLGIVLIVLGLAVGPGGWSIFNRRGART